MKFIGVKSKDPQNLEGSLDFSLRIKLYVYPREMYNYNSFFW